MEQRQDYLKKQLDQMARVLGKLLADVLGLKSEGRVMEANELVQEVFEKEIEFNLNEILTISTKDLLPFLLNKKSCSQEHLHHIANILFELGMDMEQNDDKQKYFNRAYVLFAYLNTTGITFSFDLMIKMNRIQEELS